MSSLTDTQDAALQHIFAEYTDNAWDTIVNKNSWIESLVVCDWFRNTSYPEIREILICLEQLFKNFYDERYSRTAK